MTSPRVKGLIPQPNSLEWTEREGAPTPLASLTNDDGGASTMAKAHPIRDDLTAEEVRTALDYDPATGVLTWRQPLLRSGKRQGDVAGSVRQDGRNQYRRIILAQHPYQAHRLAWLHFYGEWPDGNIDHVDGNGLNNRIGNLRIATRSQNAANCRKPETNTSGFKGVYLEKRTGKFVARITVDGKHMNLGCFDTEEEAATTYNAAAREHFGEFARTN